MAIHVHIPIKVRLRRRFAAEDGFRLRGAVERAVERALRRSRDVLDGERGPFDFEPPSFVFQGHDLPEGRRLVATQSIREGIGSALARQATMSPPPRQTRGGPSSPPRERVDRQRYRIDRYRVPSYEGGASDAEIDAPLALHQTGDFPKLGDAVGMTVRRFFPDFAYIPGNPDHIAYYGTVRLEDETLSTALWVITGFHLSGENFAWRWRQLAISVWKPSQSESSSVIVEGAGLLENDGQLVLVGRLDAENIDRFDWPVDPMPSPADRLRLLQGVGYSHLWRLTIGGTSSFMAGQSFDPISSIRFITGPVLSGEGAGAGGGRETTAQAEVSETGAGQRPGARPGGQTAGASQEAGRSGVLSDGENHGQVWPVESVDGEKIVCEPFLGEPPAHELPIGAKELERAMRRIAEALDVPFCGYAGNFCLMAAKAIAGRARAVGLNAVKDETRTRVRMSSDSSSESLRYNIEPAPTQGLEFLRRLAELAYAVSELSTLILAMYRNESANGPLIFRSTDRTPPSDPTGWMLDFLIEFSPLIRRVNGVIFAETCRVILLQQLRSSRDFIDGRGGAQLERTVDDLLVALENIGDERAGWMILKRAIAFAENPYEWEYDPDMPGRAQRVPRALPAPGDYVGAAIDDFRRGTGLDRTTFDAWREARVREEGGSFVVDFRGRTFTKGDVEQRMTLLRTILNTIDPLFLQVENFEAVYRSVRGRRDAARQFVAGLLKELREANEKITLEVSDADDGAEFAVETSGFVEAEGGRNRRGLRYEMVGIHQLADDQLRAAARDHIAYRSGVDELRARLAAAEGILSLGLTAGVILLGVLCAPLGVAVAAVAVGAAGIGLAIRDFHLASEREALYRALKSPEEILAWHEVELGYLFAQLGLVFSIFDVVGVGRGAKALLSSARTELQRVTRQGLRQAAREAIESQRSAILLRLGEGVLENAVKAGAKELGTAVAMEKFLPLMLEPVIMRLAERVSAEHGGVIAPEALERLTREVELPEQAHESAFNRESGEEAAP